MPPSPPPQQFTTEYHVFISHAGANKSSIAMQLKHELERRTCGMAAVFLDEPCLKPGDENFSYMNHAMHVAECVVFILSKEFVTSKWPMVELLQVLYRYRYEVRTRVTKPVFRLPIWYNIKYEDMSLLLNEYMGDATRRQDLANAVASCHLCQHWAQRENPGLTPEEALEVLQQELLNLADKLLDEICGIAAIRSDQAPKDDTKLCGLIIDSIIKQVDIPNIFYHESSSDQALVGLEERKREVLKLLTDPGEGSGGGPEGEEDRDCRAVLLFGVGGIGKSTLARAVFTQLASSQFHGHHRQCHVMRLPMRDYSDRAALKAQLDWLQQLECSSSLPWVNNLEDGQRLLAKKLVGERVLLLADNATKKMLSKVFPKGLFEKVLGRGSMVIATSRNADALGGLCSHKLHEVAKLPDAEAKKLLWQHARPSIPLPTESSSQKDERDLLNALVRKCGGLPLALEIIGKHWAAHVRQRASLPTIKGLISTSFRLSPEDEEDTLYSTFTASFADLHNPEALLLLLDLAAFADPQPSWHAVEAVDDEGALYLLLKYGLVVQSRMPTGDVVSMHDCVREFCGSLLIAKKVALDTEQPVACWAAFTAAPKQGDKMSCPLQLLENHELRKKLTFDNSSLQLQTIPRKRSLPILSRDNGAPERKPKPLWLQLTAQEGSEQLQQWQSVLDLSSGRVMTYTGAPGIHTITTPAAMTKLRHLCIRDMPDLHTWHMTSTAAVTAPATAPLPDLRYLEIQGCPELRTPPLLPSCLTALRLMGATRREVIPDLSPCTNLRRLEVSVEAAGQTYVGLLEDGRCGVVVMCDIHTSCDCDELTGIMANVMQELKGTRVRVHRCGQKGQEDEDKQAVKEAPVGVVCFNSHERYHNRGKSPLLEPLVARVQKQETVLILCYTNELGGDPKALLNLKADRLGEDAVHTVLRDELDWYMLERQGYEPRTLEEERHWMAYLYFQKVGKKVKEQLEATGYLVKRKGQAIFDLPGIGSWLREGRETLIEYLRQHGCVLVHGIAGIGKTTLARLVYDRLGGDGDQSAFMLNTAAVNTVKDYQQQLLEAVTGEPAVVADEAQGRELLFAALERRVKRKARLLLVVDNVWSQDLPLADSPVNKPDSPQRSDLHRILPLEKHEHLPALLQQKDDQGRRLLMLLVTSRHNLNLQDLECHLHPMKRLPDKLSLELLRWHANKDSKPGDPYKLSDYHVSEQLADLCDGVPMVLEVVGRFIAGPSQIPINSSDKTDIVKLFTIALKEGKAAGRGDGDDDKVFAALKLSYDHLTPHQQRLLHEVCTLLHGRTWEEACCYSEEVLELQRLSLLSQNQHGCVEVHEAVRLFCKHLNQKQVVASASGPSGHATPGGDTMPEPAASACTSVLTTTKPQVGEQLEVQVKRGDIAWETIKFTAPCEVISLPLRQQQPAAEQLQQLQWLSIRYNPIAHLKQVLQDRGVSVLHKRLMDWLVGTARGDLSLLLLYCNHPSRSQLYILPDRKVDANLKALATLVLDACSETVMKSEGEAQAPLRGEGRTGQQIMSEGSWGHLPGDEGSGGHLPGDEGRLGQQTVLCEHSGGQRPGAEQSILGMHPGEAWAHGGAARFHAMLRLLLHPAAHCCALMELLMRDAPPAAGTPAAAEAVAAVAAPAAAEAAAAVGGGAAAAAAGVRAAAGSVDQQKDNRTLLLDALRCLSCLGPGKVEEVLRQAAGSIRVLQLQGLPEEQLTCQDCHQLHLLQLSNMWNLRNLTSLPTSLRVLKLSSCHTLTLITLPPCHALDTLVIQDCRALTHISSLEAAATLTRLELTKLPKLHQIKSLAPLVKLVALCITGCDRVVSVEGMLGLNLLEKVEVEERETPQSKKIEVLDVRKMASLKRFKWTKLPVQPS